LNGEAYASKTFTEDHVMFRLLGFLIGSLTSIVIILLIIGMPQFHLGDEESNQERYDAAIEKLRAKQREFETVTGKLSDDVARVAQSVENETDTLTESEPEALPEPPQATSAELKPLPEFEEYEPPPLVADEPSWYSFWNPFRSELAANGFVSQLERVTGLDYRVVKVKTGVYEVAFAYRSDDERRTKLSQISMATGLELPDS
jgi:hypothetical protein